MGGDLDLGSAHHSNPNSPTRPHHRGGGQQHGERSSSSSLAATAANAAGTNTTSSSSRWGGGGETAGGVRGGGRPTRTSHTRPPRTVSSSPRQGGAAATGVGGNTGTGTAGTSSNAWLEPGSSPSMVRRSLSAPSSPSRSQSYHNTGSGGGGGGGLSSSSSLSHRLGSSHTSRFDQHLASSLGSLGIGIGGMAGKQVGVGMIGGSNNETRARASSFSSFDAALLGQISLAPSSDPGVNYPSIPPPSLRSSSYPLGGNYPLGQSVDSKFVMDQARNREFLSQSDFQYPQRGSTATRNARVTNNHPATTTTTTTINTNNNTTTNNSSNHSRSPLRASRIDLSTGAGTGHQHHHRVTTSPGPRNNQSRQTTASSSRQQPPQPQQQMPRSRSAPPVPADSR